MKEITLKVPDQKVEFVLELIAELGLEVTSGVVEIPHEHKTEVRERIGKSTTNPERLLDWEQVKDNFKLD
jgi:hypothetical protein